MSDGFEDLRIKLTDFIEKKEKDHRVYVTEFYRNIINGQKRLGFSDWTRGGGQLERIYLKGGKQLKVIERGKKERVQSCR